MALWIFVCAFCCYLGRGSVCVQASSGLLPDDQSVLDYYENEGWICVESDPETRTYELKKPDIALLSLDDGAQITPSVNFRVTFESYSGMTLNVTGTGYVPVPPPLQNTGTFTVKSFQINKVSFNDTIEYNQYISAFTLAIKIASTYNGTTPNPADATLYPFVTGHADSSKGSCTFHYGDDDIEGEIWIKTGSEERAYYSLSLNGIPEKGTSLEEITCSFAPSEVNWVFNKTPEIEDSRYMNVYPALATVSDIDYDYDNLKANQETADNTKGIWDTLLNLPSVIIDGFKNLLESLFVPDENWLTDKLSELSDTVEEHLGFLGFPVTATVDFLELLLDTNDPESTFTFPEISFTLNGTKHVIYAGGTFDLLTVSAQFPQVYSYLQLATNLLLLLLVCARAANMFGKYFGTHVENVVVSLAEDSEPEYEQFDWKKYRQGGYDL